MHICKYFEMGDKKSTVFYKIVNKNLNLFENFISKNRIWYEMDI